MANKDYAAKHEFVERVIKEVDELPLDDIIGRVVKLYPRGKHMMGLCPFHPDHNLGSFVVTPSKNIWRCFSEGIGGNGIRFEMEYYNLKFLDAVFKLALDFGIITQSEYEKFGRKKYDEIVVERLKNMVEAPRTQEHIIASQRIIHNVYSAMFEEFPLTEEHRKHLLEVRKLSEEDLCNYMSFPSRRVNVPGRVMQRIRNKMSQVKYSKSYDELSPEQKDAVETSLDRSKIKEEFKYVPGFFYDKKTKKIDFVSYSGIAVAVKDVNGNILGMQIRRDKIKKGDSRYIWFSSSFAQDNEDYEGGASPGSPAGIIFPRNPQKNRILVTEGRFKAEKIAATGNIGIFVSGVSTWRPVLGILDSLENMKNDPVYLAYDADIFGNIAVYKQLKSFAYELEKRGRKTYVVMWSKDRGKGFDDLYINEGHNYSKYIKMKPFDAFTRGYDETLKKTLAEFNATNVREIKAENALEFAERLQSEMERTFELT